MNFNKLSDSLIFKDGIWFSDKHTEISYPGKGNDIIFEIEDKSFWFGHRNKCIGTLVNKYRNEGYFIDVGGGNGVVTHYLSKKYNDIILLEPGNGVFNAKKRGIENIICSTIENAGLRNGIVPNIGLFDVIEHIKNDNTFICNIHNLLSPEGKLFISVPAIQLLWSHEDVVAGHYRRYSIKSLSKRLIDNGFHVNFISYMFMPMVVPVFLLRTIPYKLFRKNEGSLEKQKEELTRKSPVFDKILGYLWGFENKRIMRSKTIPFGTSIIAVATKK